MRAFVLCPERRASMTFVKACQHIDNYTAGHETLAGCTGAARFAYPDDHIEADHRLPWFLGRLTTTFGADPLYVHLRHDPALAAASYERAWDDADPTSVIRAFTGALVPHPGGIDEAERPVLAQFYVDTVQANIDAFVTGMPAAMTIDLASVRERFPEFWERMGADGDLEAALAEFDRPDHEPNQTGRARLVSSTPH